MCIASISLQNVYGCAVCTDLMLVSYVEMALPSDLKRVALQAKVDHMIMHSTTLNQLL